MLEKLKLILHDLGGFDLPVIHIAGTKGKGTTAHLIAKILELHGKKVGLFTSPAIFRNEEMIRINGKEISEKKLSELIERVKKIDNGLSEFELLTFAGLLYFKEENCDYTVLETGIGGLLDSTNIVENKVLTIITHIELEHTDILGKTIEEITRQKMGICREGVPLLKADLCHKVKLGFHHPESAGLAIKGAGILGFSVDSKMKKKLADFSIEGRFEIVKFGKHTFIFDGAHTVDSVKYVLQNVPEFARKRKFKRVLFGVHFLKDKNPTLWKLFPRKDSVWIPISDERAGICPDGLLNMNAENVLISLKTQKTATLYVFIGSFRLIKAVKSAIDRM